MYRIVTTNMSLNGVCFCSLYTPFTYPFARTRVIEPCSAMQPVPASQFCVTPFRPTFPGPFVAGARQCVSNSIWTHVPSTAVRVLAPPENVYAAAL